MRRQHLLVGHHPAADRLLRLPRHPSNPNDANWESSGTDGATNPENNTADDQCAQGTPESTDVFENNTPESSEESPNCNSGGPYGAASGTESPCYENTNGTDNPGGADYYRQNTPQQVNSEPGVQTSEDPDPQRSPALPFGTPGTYAGTCGVYINDGPTYEDGVTGTLTGGKADSTTNPVNGEPFNDPGWVVGGPSGSTSTDPDC